jgi:hypothetical protein
MAIDRTAAIVKNPTPRWAEYDLHAGIETIFKSREWLASRLQEVNGQVCHCFLTTTHVAASSTRRRGSANRATYQQKQTSYAQDRRERELLKLASIWDNCREYS